MRLSKKKTCKNCQIELKGICGTKIEKVFMKADRPLEPCYKPLTNRDYRAWRVLEKGIKGELEIYRIDKGL